LPSTEGDFRDFGAPLPSKKPADVAPTRDGLTGAERFWASQGMLPMPWRDGERQDALDALHLDDAQLLIANQVFADAKDEWARTVEPVARELQAVQQRRKVAGHSDVEARVEVVTAIVEASARRRACWSAARAIDERLFANLEKALGPTHEVGRHSLQALKLKRAREAAFQGSGALLSAFYKSYVPDIAEVALELRATPEERALVLAALASQCADFLPVRSAEWESAIKIQEEAEAIELRQAKRRRIGNSKAGSEPADTEARVAANQESMREITAMYANADALIAHMKRFDGELLGRMQAVLPDHLGSRLRRAMYVTGGTPYLIRVTNQRLNVLFALRGIQPDAVPAAEAEFHARLEAWEAWAEPIVGEIDRCFPTSEAVNSIDQDSPRAKRATMLQRLLIPSATDRIDQALCAIAASVRPETARRTLQLARFVPDAP
ncbi:MAG: hypothetical protein JNK53_05375, partial [Phycisphaerae bacterium]|nr:hypothetical protein [Phycisphaerae bacterium]